MDHPNVELIRRWFDMQTSHDLEKLGELFSYDLVYEDINQHQEAGNRWGADASGKRVLILPGLCCRARVGHGRR